MKFDPSQRKSFLKQALPITLVLVAGVALGDYILSKKAAPAGDEHGHGAHAEAGNHADKEHHDVAGAGAKGAGAGHTDRTTRSMRTKDTTRPHPPRRKRGHTAGACLQRATTAWN